MVRKWRAIESDSDHQQYTEQCCLVNEIIKFAKETYFDTIIEDNESDQRCLLQSTDHLMMNRKTVPRFPSGSFDLELPESFKNFFVDKIESIRACVISESPPPNLEICCDDNPHEFTDF